MNIATENGIWDFRYQGNTAVGHCPLQQMMYDPALPNYKLALLFPHGLAWIVDAGIHWTNVSDNLAGLGTCLGFTGWMIL